MRRSGILLRLARRYWPPLMSELSENTLSAVTMTTVEIIFIILATGLLTAAVFLVMEPLVRRVKQFRSF